MPRWTTRHAVFTLLLIIWALVVSTWVTWRVFGDSPPDISGSTAMAYATVFALPAGAFALWQWRHDRHKD